MSSSSTPIYVELEVTLQPLNPFSDIFIAQLGALGFESFSETEQGFLAYIDKEIYDEAAAIAALDWEGVTVETSAREIEQVNWNEEWEKNFEPIDVDGRVYIRAPFHAEKPNVDYPMLIEPKMSFGTGHHQTTHMMIQWLLDEQTAGLDVLDMGCGTGILGILAGMMGAKSLHGIDIDSWCIENTLENAERNGVHMTAEQGGADVIRQHYDLILANINLNVLLADMAHYVSALRPGGTIFFSGFYEGDIPELRARAEEAGLTFVGTKSRDDWRSIKMIKS